MTPPPTRRPKSPATVREQQLATLSDLCILLGTSPKTVKAALADPRSGFPRPVAVPAKKRAYWRVADLIAFVERLAPAPRSNPTSQG